MIALDSGQLDGLGKGEDPAKLQLQAADGRRAGRDRFLKESKQHKFYQRCVNDEGIK